MTSPFLKTTVLTVFLFLSASLQAQVRVIVNQPVVPVLIGKSYNPVLRLDFIKKQESNARVCNLKLSLDGDICSAEYFTLYSAGNNGMIDSGQAQLVFQQIKLKDLLTSK